MLNKDNYIILNKNHIIYTSILYTETSFSMLKRLGQRKIGNLLKLY